MTPGDFTDLSIQKTGGGPLRVAVADLTDGNAIKILYEGSDGATEEVVVCRVGGRVFALDSLCPHEGGRIAEGPMMEGCYLHCPLHLYRFDPATGNPVEVACMPAETFEVDEEAGEALVWVHGRAR